VDLQKSSEKPLPLPLSAVHRDLFSFAHAGWAA